jgi:hypothetical protein
MNLFNMSWFRSEKAKELEELKVVEQKLKIDLLEKEKEVWEQMDAEQEAKTAVVVAQKPYKKVKLVGNTLTVVLNDGNILSKSNATEQDFHKLRECYNENDVFAVVLAPEAVKEQRKFAEEIEKVQKTLEGVEILRNHSDFTVTDNTVYLKGINRSLPQLLVERFAQVLSSNNNDEFIALKRFFMWCCLNPRVEVADQLYNFLQQNGMKITKQGFFVALRNVVEVEGGNPEYVDFITNTYQKVKGVWKKKPSNFYVHKEEEGYSFSTTHSKPETVGNLEELYLNLPEAQENKYTDNYTKTFDIRIGKAVVMDKENCDWSTQDCARAGLHFAGHTAPYVLCGDTTVFTLHNPMKVVGIGTEKGRCWEYLPFMTTTVEEANDIMNSGDFDFLELDEQYAIDELTQLEEKVKEGFVAETKKYSFNLPQISSKEIHNIIVSLEDMRNTLSKRVSEI